MIPLSILSHFKILRMAILCCCAILVAKAESPIEIPLPPPPPFTGKLAYPFSNHAVLQQKMPIPVWGSDCLPQTNITVQFHGQKKTTTVDTNGDWKVTLDPMVADQMPSIHEAPKGHDMLITFAKDNQNAAITINDILIGEVWLCAGQSNMAGAMRKHTSAHYPENSLATAQFPALRQLVSSNDKEWLVCSPDTAVHFKRVCFFFARRIHQETLIPVGFINASFGGSSIEQWLNHKEYPTGQHFSTMVAPLAPYPIRGTIWYQGESNSHDGYAYLPKLSALIHGWRDVWNQPDSLDANGPRRLFSFYFVQLPGIGVSDPDNPTMGDGRAGIRRAFHDATLIKNTAMAICHDVGAKNEHPPFKYDTGYRLAQLALHHDYGKKNLIPTGPIYQSYKKEGSSIRIKFQYAEGLMVATKQGMSPATPSPEKNIAWLSIQAKSGSWHWANGKIDGTDLIVSSPEVAEPTAVRYAYTNNPNGALLYNQEGIPAAPFATDIPPAAQ